MSFLTIAHNEDKIIQHVEKRRALNPCLKIVWFTETHAEARRLSKDPRFETWKKENDVEFLCWDYKTDFSDTSAPDKPDIIIVQNADLIDPFLYCALIVPLILVKGVHAVVTSQKI